MKKIKKTYIGFAYLIMGLLLNFKSLHTLALLFHFIALLAFLKTIKENS